MPWVKKKRRRCTSGELKPICESLLWDVTYLLSELSDWPVQSWTRCNIPEIEPSPQEELSPLSPYRCPPQLLLSLLQELSPSIIFTELQPRATRRATPHLMKFVHFVQTGKWKNISILKLRSLFFRPACRCRLLVPSGFMMSLQAPAAGLDLDLGWL